MTLSGLVFPVQFNSSCLKSSFFIDASLSYGILLLSLVYFSNDHIIGFSFSYLPCIQKSSDIICFYPFWVHSEIAKQKEAELIIEMTKGITSPFTKTGIDEGYVDLTAFGETFYEICIKNP